ncbi:hypothetical protein B1987_03150 [Mycobacterium kansasii]|uniref:DUF5995 family protein n=1 Tax=Mycobacterium attenuatum TaxID=2341086 RepID=UPI000A0968BC|nr:DUF5995 family protein [Mycobacterium attenuatum]ORB83003.1 hypothetical protein B1987_03150 [Mycobacterium kansasii]VBA55483.1 hypothetical protein LAUMK191_03371 [Mycobacterium attenuatum]VBA59415.1 hypothetical protein LAUMK41_03467 [Mycobacterium attenuatum]
MALSPPWLHAPTVDSSDDVVDVLQSIIDWSVAAASPAGYFAVLYKRSTIAIRDAVEREVFEDGARTTRFGLTFARRYFNAAQSYFREDGKLSQVWQAAFDTNDSDEPIMLQHMLTGMNAHDTFDLGITAAETAGDSLEPLRNDFDAVNDILVSQANVIADAAEQISPGFARYRRQLTGDDIGLLTAELRQSREMAWTFAQQLLAEPESNRSKVIDDHDTIFAWWIRRHLNPPPPLSEWVEVIAREESRDTAHNIQVLDQTASRPRQ